MYHIAIVEDSAFDQKIVLDYLQQYQSKEKRQFQLYTFRDGTDLISGYPEHLDILLMDIALDKMDGIKAARLVRRKDEQVIIIFISSMIHYCIQGYSVNALDFIIKPVTYMGLKLRLDRALARLDQTSGSILLKTPEGILQIRVSNICFVESSQHKAIVHTKEKALPVNSTLQTVESQLRGQPFFRCHNSFIVNLNYIDKISGNTIWINGHMISISRYRKADFLETWTAYMGGA